MINRVLMRAVRSLLATALSALFAHWSSDPRYLALVPLLQAVGKWLREKFPAWGGVFPF